VQAGCSAILDGLAWCLGEEGDSCIVPAPMYPAFTNDFWARSRVHLHMAQTTGVCVCVCVCACVRACVRACVFACVYIHLCIYIGPDYTLTRAILDKSYTECVAAGRPPKMLLMCSPCNPTGINFFVYIHL
jgi:aspartate/methionine/tyrosine aminotransferase